MAKNYKIRSLQNKKLRKLEIEFFVTLYNKV